MHFLALPGAPPLVQEWTRCATPGAPHLVGGEVRSEWRWWRGVVVEGWRRRGGGEREGLARINLAFCLKSNPTITKKNSPLTIAKCFSFKCHGSTCISQYLYEVSYSYIFLQTFNKSDLKVNTRSIKIQRYCGK